MEKGPNFFEANRTYTAPPKSLAFMVSTTAPIQTYVKTVPKIELEAVSLFVCMVKVLIGKPQTKNTAIARCIIEAGPIDPSFSNVPLSHSLQMGSLRTASGLLSGTNLALPMQ